MEAYRANVIIPNKHVDPHEKMFDGHLLENETYVGGHVEALEAGVFRSDIPLQFKLVPSAAQQVGWAVSSGYRRLLTQMVQLIDQVDAAIKFTVEVENQKKMADVLNYGEVISSTIKPSVETDYYLLLLDTRGDYTAIDRSTRSARAT